MTITKVSYQKTYPTAPYENEKIGMEATIDEDYETVSESIEKLKKHCDEIHKKNNPQLYQEQDTIQGYNKLEKDTIDLIVKMEEKISPEQEIEDTLKGIEEATAETLPTFRIKAAQNIKTLGAYNRRKKQLNIS